jgi:carbonic anhydrase/acetyltransferase-like protein (isoleucine patch superfamily)
MRPRGTEIRKQVWVGRDVQLAESAKIIGPSYIGERTVVRAGATIGPFASVERDCVVDCGTAIERSTVLPFSYVGPGLLIQHKLQDGRYLVDPLGGEVGGEVADLQPAGLGNRIPFHGTARQESRRTPADEPEHAGAAAWGFAPFSTASQPWLQVQM